MGYQRQELPLAFRKLVVQMLMNLRTMAVQMKSWSGLWKAIIPCSRLWDSLSAGRIIRHSQYPWTPIVEAPRADGLPKAGAPAGFPKAGCPNADEPPNPSSPAPAFGTPSQPGASFGTPSTPGQPQFGKSGFAANGDPPGCAVANPLKPPPPEKALKPSPLAAAPLAESAFAKSSASPFGAKPQTSFPPPASNEVKNPFGRVRQSSWRKHFHQ
jgi:hypothetical protein